MSSESETFDHLHSAQSAANSAPGPRTVPGRTIAVPGTVSAALQNIIAAPYRTPAWDADPKTTQDWKDLVAQLAADTTAQVEKSCEQLGVSLHRDTIDGVSVYRIRPRTIAPAHRNRLLVNTHGGGYVYNPGEAGTLEGVLMAGFAQCEVLSIDYRMPPDHPFPAGLNDAMTVWKAVAAERNPRRVGLFGSSAGGGLAAATVLLAQRRDIPLPGALALGSPWVDLTETGDTYRTNEWLDNVLVSYRGYASHAARLYSGGASLSDPLISPIHGDFSDFPPTILTSGTRDLLLSLTVLTHRKLRRAGVRAELQVYEGMSHCQYMTDPGSPESEEAFTEIARFFDDHLES